MLERTPIRYQIENELPAVEFIDILSRSTLAERRPVNDMERIELMLRHANLIVTAKLNGQLIGVARSLSDFAFCTYLADLAVDVTFQKQGIGKELIRQTKLACGPGKLLLLAAPKAQGYYPKIGMQHFEHCYYINDASELFY
ncbi:MAG TPA: GNAT family N-acetyltransferase [Saprospiraceae bacterium]|nr:GNAT family N-acetyltransferase [Saprospiraceae bacterium]HMP15147.1 GNAT family N-acetyltransferase [Saprospiraceae bacterium]